MAYFSNRPADIVVLHAEGKIVTSGQISHCRRVAEQENGAVALLIPVSFVLPKHGPLMPREDIDTAIARARAKNIEAGALLQSWLDADGLIRTDLDLAKLTNAVKPAVPEIEDAEGFVSLK